MQGILLLKAEDISEPNLPEMINESGSSLLFYKIVWPREIYYGKVLNVK